MKDNKQILEFFIFIFYLIFINFFFRDILNSNNVILDLGFKRIDFQNEDPFLWIKVRKVFHITNIFLFSVFFIYTVIDQKKNIKKIKIKSKEQIKTKRSKESEITYNEISLSIGFNNSKDLIYIEKNALFQNVLITGSIGSGKTQSAILPMTEQILKYKKEDDKEKIAALILDVKGNFCQSVEEICKRNGRFNDIIKIELNGKYKYNPLHKPNLKPQVIANRLKTILMLLSPENSEMYWIDKAEQLISECIKFIRIYNKGYVNFDELSKLIFKDQYYLEKKDYIKNQILKKRLSQEDVFNLKTFIEYFENEFLNLDERTSAIIKSEISRITNIFVSDYEINSTFCPSEKEINFLGFEEMLEKGKIVVLNMNLSQNTILAKIIATYLKLDFQSEVLTQLKYKKDIRISSFICDEYQEYVTKTDANFYAQSREAKCINIVSTQSYTSLKNTLKDKEACEVIIQNLLNKIWFRNDDSYTVESAISQIGKVYKEKLSTTISENSNDSEYNYILKTFISFKSNLSESINKSKNLENKFEVKDFTQNLKIFEAIIFLTNKEITTEKAYIIPYFKRKEFYERKRIYN